MKDGRARVIRAALLIGVVAILVAFGRTVDWGQTWQSVQSTSPTLLGAAAIVNLLSILLKGVRWWVFLRPIGVRSLWLAIRATFAGAALNNLFVANSGEAARVLFVTRGTGVAGAKALATIALERLFELVGYITMLAISVSVLALPAAIEHTRPYALAVFVALIGLLVYLVRHPERAEIPLLESVGILRRARNYGARFAQTLTNVSTTRRFLLASGLSVLAWTLQVATYALTARAAQFPISLVGTIAAILAVNLGFAIRTTPGNLGVFQLMYAVTAVAFGLDRDAAIGVALLIQAQQIVPVTILGMLAAPRLLLETPRQVI